MTENLYLIVGRSGSGKTTITEALRDRYGYQLLRSYTDRPKRYEGEDNHVFLTPEQFDCLDEMVAYTEFDGHRYGATQKLVDECDLYVIDPDGVYSLMERYHGDRKVYTIGIDVPLDVLTERMAERGDTWGAIMKRRQNDDIKFKDMHKVCDIIFENIDLNQTINDIQAYITEQETRKLVCISADSSELGLEDYNIRVCTIADVVCGKNNDGKILVNLHSIDGDSNVGAWVPAKYCRKMS